MTKKIGVIAIICVLFLLNGLNGCVWDPPSYYFDYENLKGQIEKVEMINYENEKPKKIKKVSEILPYDFDKEEVLETLPADKIDSFAIDLSEMGFLINSDSANAPVGICIKVTYKNGEFIIISWTLINDNGYCFVEIFDPQGYLIEHVGWVENRKDFVALVNKYFEHKIR